jgi:hypothetical protein
MLAFVAVACGMFAIADLAQFARFVIEERAALQRGEPLRPGVRFGAHVTGTFGTLSAITTLLLIALLAASADGWWRLAPLILVNLVIQPLSFLLVYVGVLTLWHTLRGRLVFAGRVIPKDAVPSEQRRVFLIHRLASGLFGVALGCTLGCATLLLLCS